MAGISDSGFEIKRLPEIKSDLETLMRIALGSDATLLPDSVEGQVIVIFAEIFKEMWEELGSAYSAFNPISVTGQSLDNLVFLNGLSRLAPAQSSANLQITGVDNTVIPVNSIIEHNGTKVEFLTENSVEIGVGFPTGTATVIAKSRKNGALEALAGTLTVISSPVNGWDTVTNGTDAKLGRNAETDSQLRSRRDRSLSIAGSASLTNIIAEVARVAAVTHAGGVENTTNATDVNGLPPHSFEIIVEGGDNNSIAQSIWDKKPAGILANGDIPINVIDILGNSQSVSFSRPIGIPIYFNANITFIGTVPSDAAQVLENALLSFVAGGLIAGEELSVGDDVIPSRLYLAMNVTYTDMIINVLETGLDGIVYDTIPMPIEFNEISQWASARISIVVG